jgi:outer membrane receptor protein involved in Fe transport
VVSFAHESGRRTLGNLWTEPVTMVDVNAVSGPWFGHFSVGAAVKNLFDTTYRLPGGLQHPVQTIEQRGRVALVEVRTRF